MGKIVAVGGGSFEYGEIWTMIEYIRSLTDKEHPKMLFLPTASFDSRDDTPKFIEAFAKYGCTGDALYLTDESLTYDEIKEKILGSDIVYVDGGNLKFLMDTWNKTGATEIFREAYEKGIILSGLSSGAMCWFDMGWDDCLEGNEFAFIDCVGLLPYCNCPHFEADYWHRFKDEIKKLNGPDGMGIDNDVCVGFIDGKIEVVKHEQEKSAFLYRKANGFEEEDMAELYKA